MGVSVTTEKGNPMVVQESGTIEKKRRWVGLLRSPNGWETMETNYGDDFTREELIYEGHPGSAIKISHRIFHAGSVIPAKNETLTFDISTSDTVCIEKTCLKILDADDAHIVFIVKKYPDKNLPEDVK